MDGLLSFSFLPLRLALWLGLLAIVGAGLVLLIMLWRQIVTGWSFPLFKWLTVVLFGFMGVQFILLWILGEYIGRIYNDVRARPIYVIGETVNVGDK